MKNIRSTPLFEFKRPDDVVLIPVRLKDMSNNQFIPVGYLKINIAIPRGSITAALPPDPIR